MRAKKAIVAIGTEKGAVGSGFFIPSSNGLRLITCLHVLNAALNRGTLSYAQLLYVGVGRVFDPKYLARIVAHDEMLDVAILEITQRLDGEKLKIMGARRQRSGSLTSRPSRSWPSTSSLPRRRRLRQRSPSSATARAPRGPT